MKGIFWMTLNYILLQIVFYKHMLSAEIAHRGCRGVAGPQMRAAILGNILELKVNLILAPKIFLFSLKITVVLIYQHGFCPNLRIKQLLYWVCEWSLFSFECSHPIQQPHLNAPLSLDETCSMDVTCKRQHSYCIHTWCFLCVSQTDSSQKIWNMQLFFCQSGMSEMFYMKICAVWSSPPYVKLYIHPVYNIHTVYTYAADVQRGIERGQKVLDVTWRPEMNANVSVTFWDVGWCYYQSKGFWLI